MRSALREFQPGPCHEVRDNSGNENFVGLRERHDPCRRVHRHSANIPASDFNFASMEAGTRLQANLFYRRAKASEIGTPRMNVWPTSTTKPRSS